MNAAACMHAHRLDAPRTLARGEVDVWWVSAADPWSSRGRAAMAQLSATELAGFERLRDESVRRVAAAHRVALRTVLAAYLGVTPGEVELRRHCAVCGSHAHGKPFVPGAGVRFSLSHSGRVAAIAVAMTDVGVDVERIDQRFGFDGMASLVLTDEEDALYRRRDADQRRAFFLASWVRKEAFVKASGVGLSTPLPGIRLIAAHGDRVHHGFRAGEAPLDVVDLLAPRGTAAALATVCSPLDVRVRVAEPNADGTISLHGEMEA